MFFDWVEINRIIKRREIHTGSLLVDNYPCGANWGSTTEWLKGGEILLKTTRVKQYGPVTDSYTAGWVDTEMRTVP